MEMATLSFYEEELMRPEVVFMDKDKEELYGFCWRWLNPN
jgi:hypothetical protein